MPTHQSTIDDLMHRLADAGRVRARKMFGEYCVYLDDKPVALVCDDVLYVKPTNAGRKLVPDAEEGPPYPGAKLHLAFPPDTWKDGQLLCRLLRETHGALPKSKPRTKKVKGKGRRR